ncbi:hypothetical protein ACYULU_06985 [Breznakiellaceae bacterium SP9]
MQNKTHSRDFNLFVPLTIILLAAGFFAALFTPFLAQMPQKYTDFAWDWLSNNGLSKTQELNLFWIILFGGLAFLAVYFYSWHKNHTPSLIVENESNNNYAILCFLIPFAVTYIVWGWILPYYIFLAFAYCIISIYKKEYAVKGTLLIFFTYIAIISFSSIGAFFFAWWKIKKILVDTTSMAAGIFLLAVITGANTKEESLDKVIMALQIPVPFLLLTYLLNRYKYGDEIVYLPFPPLYYVLIGGLIVALLVIACTKCAKKWSKPANASELIFVSSIIAIFIFHSFADPKMVFPLDVWHNGERILPYQQVVNLGQRLYVDYFPSSGLFPMVVGFFQNVFLGGTATVFYAGAALFKIYIALAIIILCYFHVRGIPSLVIASVVVFTGYERVFLILPSLLLLFLPCIAEKKSLWLKMWCLLCLANILYYPLFGGAFSLGTLPFAIIQAIRFFKSGEWNNKKRNVLFYAGWVLCLSVIAYFVPLLLKMATVTLSFSEQTQAKDGISLLHSNLPNFGSGFLPATDDGSLGRILILRKLFFLAVNMDLSLILVFIAFLCFLICVRKNKSTAGEGRELFALLGFLSVIIVTIVSYTYTQVRADVSGILSRSAAIDGLLAVFLFILIQKYTEDVLPAKGRYILFSLIFSSMLLYTGQPIDSNQIRVNIPVDADTFVKIDADLLAQIPRIGKGFISTGAKNDLVYFNSLIKKTAKPVIINQWALMHYYTLNIPYLGGYLHTLGSKALQQRNTEIYGREMPAARDIDRYGCYYAFHWFVVDKHYLPGEDFWLPIEDLKQIYGEDYAPKDIRASWDADIGLVSNSFGRSIDTLRDLFTDYDADYTVSADGLDIQSDGIYKVISDAPRLTYEFNENIYGDDADFVYIEFNRNKDSKRNLKNYIRSFFVRDEKNLSVKWKTSDGYPTPTITCRYGREGKLLIPLGSMTSWLLSENKSITFQFDLPVGDTIELKKIEFLKLDTNMETKK